MASRLPRFRTIVLIGASAVVVIAAVLVALRMAAGGSDPGELSTRTVRAGDIEVKVTPLSLDSTGARFRINLDTHSGSLDINLAQTAKLRVDGRETAAGVWSGTEPGGHHREGTLTFANPVSPGVAVDLDITGLPQPATAAWTAP